MKINLFFLESELDLSAENRTLLRKIIKKHATRAGKLLEIDLLNITIYPTKDVISETGEAAYAKEGTNWVQISIDPARNANELAKTIENIIPATVYHEVDHIGREKHVGKIGNLLDAVISEGLADVFAEEQWPYFKAPWSVYQKKQIQPYLRKLSAEKKNKKYSHNDWFFGTGEMPRWLGYKLGSYIIHSAKERNTNLTAFKMTQMKSAEIIKLSGIIL